MSARPILIDDEAADDGDAFFLWGYRALVHCPELWLLQSRDVREVRSIGGADAVEDLKRGHRAATVGLRFGVDLSGAAA